jgi:hypothetical protein
VIGDKTVFGSTLTYQLGRELGIERAAREFQNQLRNTDRNSVPCARVFARLSKLTNLQVYHGASTTLPKARSRAAHAALQSHASYWLMCDDDVEADTGTLLRMFELAGEPTELRAVVLPCLMRGAGTEQETVNVQFEPGSLLQFQGSVPWRAADRAGTGCMLLTAGALHAVTEYFRSELEFVDDDRDRKVALFQLLISDEREPFGQWLGEDFSFCDRLHGAGVELRALLSGASMHAGSPLALDNVR